MQQVKHILKAALLIGLVFALLAFSLHGISHLGHDCGPHCPVCAAIRAARGLLMCALLLIGLFALRIPDALRLSVDAVPSSLFPTPVSLKVRLSE